MASPVGLREGGAGRTCTLCFIPSPGQRHLIRPSGCQGLADRWRVSCGPVSMVHWKTVVVRKLGEKSGKYPPSTLRAQTKDLTETLLDTWPLRVVPRPTASTPAGSVFKRRILGPTPDLINENVPFNKIVGDLNAICHTVLYKLSFP